MSLALYVLPSVHEWYKAAYYDPTATVYYDYPTGSDGVPDGIDFAGDTSFDAVFNDGGVNPQPNDINDVGVLSPYGTAGQGGNVAEWEETAASLSNDHVTSARLVRGGVWSGDSFQLQSSFLIHHDPLLGSSSLVGFRVASIPEPSTLLLGTLAAVGLLVTFRRSTK